MNDGASADKVRLLSHEKIGLEVVLSLAPQALEFYQAQLKGEHKPDRSWVSQADRQLEVAARQLLARHVMAQQQSLGAQEPPPLEVGFLGEEFGAFQSLSAADPLPPLPELDRATRASALRRCWILDPIDGTTCFLSQIPTWSLLLAYAEEGRPEVGIVCFPALGQVFWGSSGNGAFSSDFVPGQTLEEMLKTHAPRRCHVRRTPQNEPYPLSQAFVSYSSPGQFAFRGLGNLWSRLSQECGEFRTIPDAFGHSRVLCGGIDAHIDVIAAPYDLAAVQVLYRETEGAFFGDYCGDPVPHAFRCGGAIGAASPALAQAYQSVLSACALSSSLGAPGEGSPADLLLSDVLRVDFHRAALRARFGVGRSVSPSLSAEIVTFQWQVLGATSPVTLGTVSDWPLQGSFLEITVDAPCAGTAIETDRLGPLKWVQRGDLQEMASWDAARDVLSEMTERLGCDLNRGAFAGSEREGVSPAELLESPGFVRREGCSLRQWNEILGRRAPLVETPVVLVRSARRRFTLQGEDLYTSELRLGRGSHAKEHVTSPPSTVPVVEGKSEDSLALEALRRFTQPFSRPPDVGGDAFEARLWEVMCEAMAEKVGAPSGPRVESPV